eukprot:1713807-Alexandrium_andersonii.AAC.1
MSASLVGSEMCIRDRERRSPPAAPATKATERKKTAAMQPPRGSHFTAVSYTHLTLPTICSV